MPLDSAFTFDNPLMSLGIVPVAQEVVEQYKAEYLEAVIAKRRQQHRSVRHVKWQTLVLSTYKLATFEEFLGIHTEYMSSDRSLPPPELIALAEHVRTAMPSADFAIEYLDVDPIMWVLLGDKKVCLGIWNEGAIIAMATVV